MKMFHAAVLAIMPALALSASPVLAEESQKAALTIDSPIEALMANDATKAIVIKHLGPLNQHPFYDQFKSMTLVQVQPMSNGQITAETIEKIKADLAEVA